jgi:hypothetical protein
MQSCTKPRMAKKQHAVFFAPQRLLLKFEEMDDI